MQSPEDSSKHSLVTYGSDISDEEIGSVSNIPLPTREHSNDPSDLRSMDISPITNDSKSVCSNEPSPKDKKSAHESAVAFPIKKRKTIDNIGGLVSYPMDENDDNEYDSNDNDMEHYSGDENQLHYFSKESSNDYTENFRNISHNNRTINLHAEDISGIDNEECFNAEDRESDMDNDAMIDLSGSAINTRGHQLPNDSHGIDLKSMSGQSSSKVKAIVLTKRPKGTELAYLLSRQIYNNRQAEIHLPNLPTAKPPPEHEIRITELRTKAKSSPWSMTQSILNNKEYRNPSIYEKLIEHMKIDERGTNYPPELYDPYRFGDESYYEVLSKVQDAAERKRLELDSSGTASGNKINKNVSTKSNSEMRMRKTKWDTGSKPAAMVKSYSSSSGIVIETKTMFPVHK